MNRIRTEKLLSTAVLAVCLAARCLPQTADSASLVQQAVSAQQRGDFATAIRQYRQALKDRPDLLAAWTNLGVSLVQTGAFDEAIESYRSALALDPHNRQIRTYLALAYFKKGEPAAACKSFEELLREAPKDIRVATLSGASCLQAGDNERALAALQPLAATAGDNPDFLWAYSSALVAQGRRREGAAAAEKVARQTNAAEAWLLAGQNLLALNEFVQARTDLENAARANPALPGVQTALGQAREKNADYRGAIEAFGKAVEQNAKDLDAWLGLGGDQYFERDLTAARASLKKALETDPASAPAYYALALVEKAEARPAAAAANLEQAVRIRPDWMEAHIQLAALYVQLQRAEEGARERELVDRLAEQQRKNGPGKF